MLGYELGEEDVQAWLDSDDLGYEHLSDDQIVKQVERLHSVLNDENESEEDDTSDSSISCPLSNAEAMNMTDKCLTWLQHQPEYH